jgi:hypothetical protein
MMTAAGEALGKITSEKGADAVCAALGCSITALRFWIDGRRSPRMSAKLLAHSVYGIAPDDWTRSGGIAAPRPMARVGEETAVGDLTVRQFCALMGGTVVLKGDK